MLFNPDELYPIIPDTTSVVNDALLDNLGDEVDAKRVDKVDDTTTYIGYVQYSYDFTTSPPQRKLVGDPSKPIWKILRISTNGTVLIREYASGNENYDKIWDNRAALAYE